MIPIQVQSQFQSTTTFPPSMPMLHRDLSDSTLASIEQPLHSLPSVHSSDHQPVTTSATLQKLTREAAAKATPSRKKKPTQAEFETRIESARIAYGGSA
ncbi:hypothetical protein BGW39_003505, partial [Mortierella sp. 14UC]